MSRFIVRDDSERYPHRDHELLVSNLEIGRPVLRQYVVFKRLMDIMLSCLALLALSPLLMAIGFIVRITSQGPAIYRQRRVGKDGATFKVWKFRTMFINQDDEIYRAAFRHFLHGIPFHDAPDALRFKLQGDPRVTPVGRFLRRTSLDELPQLWNIICGDMSLVGPRPAIPYEVAHYSDYHRRRLAVTPGLTGLWQVRGRSRVTFEEMIALDLEYIAHRSLWLDLRLILATVPVLLGQKGAA